MTRIRPKPIFSDVLLDAVVADVLDPQLMEAAKAAEIILERKPYSDQFLKEVKKEVA